MSSIITIIIIMIQSSYELSWQGSPNSQRQSREKNKYRGPIHEYYYYESEQEHFQNEYFFLSKGVWMDGWLNGWMNG
jgi:hypothetical protein